MKSKKSKCFPRIMLWISSSPIFLLLQRSPSHITSKIINITSTLKWVWDLQHGSDMWQHLLINDSFELAIASQSSLLNAKYWPATNIDPQNCSDGEDPTPCWCRISAAKAFLINGPSSFVSSEQVSTSLWNSPSHCQTAPPSSCSQSTIKNASLVIRVHWFRSCSLEEEKASFPLVFHDSPLNVRI